MTSAIPEPHPGPDLLITPQAKGTAAVSEYANFAGLMSQVYLWIAQDVDDSKETSVDEMLKEILADCAPRPRMPLDEAGKTRLLDDCLREVLPICNGVTQAKSKIIEAKSCQVKENLQKYSEKRLENELYAPFVIAANTALLFLAELQTTHLRRAEDSDFICFHVLDPSVLVQGHKGRISERKPDVIVLSESDARNAHEGSAVEFSQHAFLLEKATGAKKTRFQWRNIRTFVEFKRHDPKKGMEPPPESYSIQPTPTKMMLPRESGAVSAMPTAPASSSAKPPPPPVTPVRRSARQQEKSKETGSSDRKRALKQSSKSTSQSKRPKSSSEQQKGHGAIVQAGGYAAELFATHVGRLHVFGLIIVGDMLYLWRYDREGAIQCSGFNFIQDLPRFMVLLLAMQRFENQDWGLNPYVDPDFGQLRPHETTLTGTEDTDQMIQITISLNLSHPDRFTHFGLNGRATNVFPVRCNEISDNDGLVAKVFWPEAKRQSEPDILKKVDKIAEQNEDVSGHIPKIFWYKKFEEMSTAKIRERLGLPSRGSRVLYIIIFQKLRPIHELSGNDFLQAWWATVKCHYVLWKNGIFHRDISESNLMYHRDIKGRIMGVLNDFDLATTHDNPTGTGTQRTGTLPFMALGLLQDDLGRTQPLYEHDAESFIWVLIWISLQYNNGTLRNPAERRLDGWLGKDATQCRKEKRDFLHSERLGELAASEGHERSWALAQDCMYALRSAQLNRGRPGVLFQPLDVDTAFNTLLYDPFMRSVVSP